MYSVDMYRVVKLDFIIRFRSILALIFFSLFCLISMSVYSSKFSLSVEGVGSAFILPFQKGYHSMQQGIHMLWAGFTELNDVRDELDKTRKQLQKYEAASEELDQIKSENQQLRSMLGMKAKVGYDSIPGMIISKDPDNWFRTIIVNRGSNDGVKVNMPVLGYNGDMKAIIGKVVDVKTSVCRILPIISPELKIGVMMQDSRYPGLLTGYSANSVLCRVDFLSRSAQLKPDDVVITSGQGGIFPQGLVVGKIQKVIAYKTSSFQQVVVKPIIDYEQLDQVFIIREEPDSEIMQLLKDVE
jgi:rod shape-determining protein MreC